MGRRLLFVALIVCLAALAGALACELASRLPDLAPISTARAILALSPQAAENQLPISLPDAVVTSFDPEIRLIFVQDATAGVSTSTRWRSP